jgi:probable phosphoglycerate mutase
MNRPDLWLCRHGETEWSRSGRHTSSTDLGLTPAGEEAARRCGAQLAELRFDLVLTSPLLRARTTAELAGHPDALVDGDAAEWDYGELEGLTTPEIRRTEPGWTIWQGKVPGGETVGDVAARADRLVERVRRQATERALLFGHGHLLRVVGARWLDLPGERGEQLRLGTATLCQLGWEREAPAIERWNIGS